MHLSIGGAALDVALVAALLLLGRRMSDWFRGI